MLPGNRKMSQLDDIYYRHPRDIIEIFATRASALLCDQRARGTACATNL